MFQLAYYEPQTLKEALQMDGVKKGTGKFLAGGTDLLVQIKRRKIEPQELINLKAIPELKGVQETGDGGIRIGAAVTVKGIMESSLILAGYPAMAQAAKELGTPQVRNRATIGGNIVNASPAADLVGPLLVYDAILLLTSESVQRRVKIEDFLLGPSQTALGKEEVLEAIELPALPAGTGAVYLKHGLRKTHEIALVGVSIALRSDGQGVIEDCRIALTAVAPKVIRAREAEDALKGCHLDDETLSRVAHIAEANCLPISDVRASADYRRQMVGVLTKRGLLSLGGSN
ncbi:MAG: xanthine dehydrogenase family protein subunit M [Clostridia bacterium]|nr:xanthine dehydrogenase family protein subunit M [Clostridia bacterium]